MSTRKYKPGDRVEVYLKRYGYPCKGTLIEKSDKDEWKIETDRGDTVFLSHKAIWGFRLLREVTP